MLYLSRSGCWSDQRDEDRAIADATAAIRLDPTFSKAYAIRSSSWARKKEYRRALADCDEAIRLDPRSPDSYLTRAVKLYQLEDYDRALADCDEAIRLDPKYHAAHSLRGVILAHKGRFGTAVAELILHPPPIKISVASGSQSTDPSVRSQTSLDPTAASPAKGTEPSRIDRE